MKHCTRRLLASGAGAALLAAFCLSAEAIPPTPTATRIQPTPTAPPVGPPTGLSVASMGLGRFTVFARQNDLQGGGIVTYFKSLDRAQSFSPDGIAQWETTGWQTILGPTDFNSDPDSTIDQWQQWVVGRRSLDNGCWYAVRPKTDIGEAYAAWSGWTKCDSTFTGTMAFSTGFSVAAVNDPVSGMSVVHVFGVANGQLFHQAITEASGAPRFATGWTTVPGGVKDITSTPDAVAYVTDRGPRLAVCAQRFAHVVYCTNYDVAGDTWSVWSQLGVTKDGYGPGLTSGLHPNGYEVYVDNGPNPATVGSVSGRSWLNDRWNVLGWYSSTIVPTSDPDAATFADLFRSNLPSTIVCVGNGPGILDIRCSFSDGATFGPWFAP